MCVSINDNTDGGGGESGKKGTCFLQAQKNKIKTPSIWILFHNRKSSKMILHEITV